MNNDCLNCFKLLAIPSRFRIFNYLKKHKEKVNITSLVKFLALRQPTVSFHVEKMVECGLVEKIKKGRDVYCRLHKRCRFCLIFD